MLLSLKIVLTNWVNFLVIFIVLYLVGFLSAHFIDGFSFSDALVETLFALLGYGIIFWIGFFIVIAILDTLLFSFKKEPVYINNNLYMEWIIISSPFIYWLIKYNQLFFLVAILAFIIGQYLRRPYILKILE